MTTVINLFGGPGCGKSTVAAQLYGYLKSQGKSVELVQEYVKSWVYLERKPCEYDLLHLLGQQSQRESIIYGKVDYIITDSPFLLAGVYQEYLSDFKYDYVKVAAKKFIQQSEHNGVIYRNFVLKRGNSYDNSGRFENLEKAQEIDNLILKTLKDCDYYYVEINCPENFRYNEILKALKL